MIIIYSSFVTMSVIIIAIIMVLFFPLSWLLWWHNEQYCHYCHSHDWTYCCCFYCWHLIFLIVTVILGRFFNSRLSSSDICLLMPLVLSFAINCSIDFIARTVLFAPSIVLIVLVASTITRDLIHTDLFLNKLFVVPLLIDFYLVIIWLLLMLLS